ncbi:hypothetical protein PHBOTO_006636 [Pseudozyma hubeiensis]|nr:hypothetical protein PHBOTO_006406 [Pseudozyma hubeiensis]KAJ9478947.1 hypothetical protein PHBOTO_006636 [Pseudozyma hubeiensis]
MKTFCCCIPVRLGVLILAPATTVLASLLAYTQLSLLINYQNQYGTFEKAIHGALAGITILIALASLFGLLGAVLARRSLVAFYSNILWLGLLIFAVLGGIEIWQLFRNKDSFASQCEARTNSNTEELQSLFGSSLQGPTDEVCKKLADINAIVITVLFGILVLVLAWLINIVSQYKHQLRERDSTYAGHAYAGRGDRSRVFGNLGKNSGYHPTETREVDESGATLLHTTQPPAGWKDMSYQQPPHHHTSGSYATYSKA